MDLHLRDAFPHLSGCPRFLQHELYDEIIHPTDFVIEPKMEEKQEEEADDDEAFDADWRG